MKKEDDGRGNDPTAEEKIANTFVKPSKIHGLGLFAKTFIPKGTEIVHGVADYSSHVDEWIAYNKRGGTRSKNFCCGLCMVNHSEAPNMHRPTFEVMVTSRDVEQGEEITENYDLLPDGSNPFKGHWEDALWEIMENKKYQKLKI